MTIGAFVTHAIVISVLAVLWYLTAGLGRMGSVGHVNRLVRLVRRFICGLITRLISWLIITAVAGLLRLFRRSLGLFIVVRFLGLIVMIIIATRLFSIITVGRLVIVIIRVGVLARLAKVLIVGRLIVVVMILIVVTLIIMGLVLRIFWRIVSGFGRLSRLVFAVISRLLVVITGDILDGLLGSHDNDIVVVVELHEAVLEEVGAETNVSRIVGGRLQSDLAMILALNKVILRRDGHHELAKLELDVAQEFFHDLALHLAV